jgi:DNA modification methylase
VITNKIYQGDCIDILKTLPDQSIQCCVTSPPYWGLRDYGHDGQIGLEKTPEEYVSKMVSLFREVKRVLKDDGTLWLNLGDSYNGSGGDHKEGKKNDASFQGEYSVKCGGKGRNISSLKAKDLCGIPWRVAFALQADGWYLRQDIIWHKPNPMPESVTDRCTKSHEYIFLFSKSTKYYFDNEKIKEKGVMESSGSSQRNTQETHGLGGGNSGINEAKMRMKKELEENGYVMRNKRSVWTVTTKPFSGAHFATFPEDLILPCILAGCPAGEIVLDPFMGAGTTALVAKKNGCKYIGCELNPEYIEIAEKRLSQDYLFNV